MMPVWTVICIVPAVVILAVTLTALYVREKDRRKISYMLDAFEDNEHNFRYIETSEFNRTLNRIKWLVERSRRQNEQESWTKLIRVLTHEIMNTVSPIASLSDALGQYLDIPEKNRSIDIKDGLATISTSSKNLIKFVESYREMAGVAKPVKKGLMVDELVRKVIDLTSGICTESDVTCCCHSESEDMLIYADESQISRIIINLIKNAVQAHARTITISSHIDREEQTIITVANDGQAIGIEAQEQIFIPFFTTKPDGSGIGLSLSKQIMQAHNGTLELTRSDNELTVFTLTFK